MTDDDDALVAAVMASSRSLVAIAAVSIEASPVELTLAQYRALVLLVTRGALRISDLKDAMRLSPSSATRLVDRLQRKALVERHRSQSSGRETELHLTALGREVVDVVMAVRRQEIKAVVAELPSSRRKALRAAFEDFARASGELSVDPLPSPMLADASSA